MPIRQATRLQAVMQGWRDRGYILGNTHLDRPPLPTRSFQSCTLPSKHARICFSGWSTTQSQI
eukprot:1595938-Prymnesium_polylepis.1